MILPIQCYSIRGGAPHFGENMRRQLQGCATTNMSYETPDFMSIQMRFKDIRDEVD
jgi:hypothetical protein